MDLRDYLDQYGAAEEDSGYVGARAQGDFEYSPGAIAQLQAQAEAPTRDTLARGWETNRSIADTGRFIEDLVQRVTGRRFSRTPEEMSLSRRKLAPIMEGLDNLTLGQGSKIPAGLAALVQSAGDGFSIKNLKGHYDQNRGKQQEALNEWENSIPNLPGGSVIPALRGVETVAGAIGSPMLGAVLNKVPGYAGLAGRGLAGKAAQGTIPIALTAALDKYAPGLTSRLGVGSLGSAPTASQDTYGPAQQILEQRALYKVGDGDWKNGLDSLVGKNFSKGSPGSAALASERYNNLLEPNREDQVTQLYNKAVSDYANQRLGALKGVLDPRIRKAELAGLALDAHKFGLSSVPEGARGRFPGPTQDSPLPNTETPPDESSGEGWERLAGLAALLGAGFYGLKKGKLKASELKKVAEMAKNGVGGAAKAGTSTLSGGKSIISELAGKSPGAFQAGNAGKIGKEAVKAILAGKRVPGSALLGRNPKRDMEILQRLGLGKVIE